MKRWQMKLSTIRLHQYWILREEHDAMVGHATGKLRWDEKALQQQFLVHLSEGGGVSQ